MFEEVNEDEVDAFKLAVSEVGIGIRVRELSDKGPGAIAGEEDGLVIGVDEEVAVRAGLERERVSGGPGGGEKK